MSDKTSRKGKAWEGEEAPAYDYVLPLRDVVLFPGMVVPLFVGRPRSTAAIDVVVEEGFPLLAITQKDSQVDDPLPKDLYSVGTLCTVLQTMRLPDGSYKVLLEGLSRKMVFEYSESAEADTPFLARTLPMPDRFKATRETEAKVRYIRDLFQEYVRLFKKIPKENLLAVLSIEDPSVLSDQIAAHLNVKTETKQELLTANGVEERLNLLAKCLEGEIDILEVENKIKGEVRSQIDKSQREYYLTEQIKAIQRELGRDGESLDEIEEYREKLNALGLPKEAFQRAEKELNRLATMAPMSPEATVVRTYLDWIIDLPWNKASDEILELDEAEKVLEKDHYGLKKPKERILEYLAVRKLNPKTKGPILCFVGPPGVGKTSLGKSIARATRREFARISLGGMRDEAEIRGHRRTYIGSMPGRIIQTLKKVKTKNPVILLDEIDKMNSDFRGDPGSALLEVLDPEQNKHFSDNYLEIEFDLSQVFFITTANVLHTIPPALRDRMEVIDISSYTEQEKVQIARRYLAPRAVRENGLKRSQIGFKQS
ncbi:MAG: endopeptidase La, partial [Candidatus Omnitrophica bacterium]|nr:endopeptidase La [Candidatus Omnitrophota bacterium]